MVKKTKDIKLNITFAKPEYDDPIKQKEHDTKVLAEYVYTLMEMDSDRKKKLLDEGSVICAKCKAEISETKDFAGTSFSPMCRECYLKDKKENPENYF